MVFPDNPVKALKKPLGARTGQKFPDTSGEGGPGIQLFEQAAGGVGHNTGPDGGGSVFIPAADRMPV